MATVSVTNSFSPNTLAEAAEVNANFTDLVNFINTNTVHKDGSVSMTGQLTLPASDPTTANQATRKSYVDARTDRMGVRLRTENSQLFQNTSPTTMLFDTEDEDTHDFIDLSGSPAGICTVPAGCAGMYLLHFGVNRHDNPVQSFDYLIVYLMKNSTAIALNQRYFQGSSSANSWPYTVCALDYLAEGDTFSAKVSVSAPTFPRGFNAALNAQRVSV